MRVRFDENSADFASDEGVQLELRPSVLTCTHVFFSIFNHLKSYLTSLELLVAKLLVASTSTNTVGL